MFVGHKHQSMMTVACREQKSMTFCMNFGAKREWFVNNRWSSCVYQGETPLFLSALHGCYDTARLLLLHGANLDLHDRRGRRPIDVAREGMRHQVLELLLAHQIQRGPVTEDSPNDIMWDERTMMYSPWVASPGLPGRSASFSGVLGHRDMTPPPPPPK